MNAGELYPVTLTNASAVPVAGDRPVLFHGVNKSGSLAMANVMREAYYAQRRANEFFCTYHGVPKQPEDFERIVASSRGHQLFISHYVYRDIPLPPGSLLVTQLRHPLPRVLSVYGWLKRNHLNRSGGTLEGFPGLEQWIRAMKGRGHTEMMQFAKPLGTTKDDVKGLTNAEAYEVAVENFDRDVVWFGIAELFEESIFTLAHLCGLEAVPPWEKDTRNRWRQPLADTDPRIIDLIHETYEHEFRFYERGLALFRERIAGIDFGPAFAAYKERCGSEYGERLVS